MLRSIEIFAAAISSRKRFIITRLTLALSLLGLFLFDFLPAAPAYAAVGINSSVNFQGRLLNAAGAVVADGQYNMQFKLYQDGTGTVVANPGGTLMWTESWIYGANTPDNRVTVKNGYFSIPLGSICSFSATTCTAGTGNAQVNAVVDFNQDTLWLSTNIGTTASTTATSFAVAGGDGEMIPMRRLGSSVYALNAGKLGGLSSAGFIQNASAAQQTATFNILSGAATTVAAAQIQTVASATAPVLILKGGATPGTGGDLLQLQSSAAAVLFRVDSTGTLGSADVAAVATNSTGTTLRTGNSTTSGNSGDLTLGTGTATSGNSGNILIDTGGATGTKGSVNIGTTNAAAINLNQNTVIAADKSLTFGFSSGNTAALQLSVAATTLFTVDTTNNRVTLGAVGTCNGAPAPGPGRLCVNTSTSTSGASVVNSNSTTLVTGTAAGSTISSQYIVVKDNSVSAGNILNVLTLDSTATTNANTTVNSIIAKVPASQSGNFLQFQNGASPVVTITNAGAITTTNTLQGSAGTFTGASALALGTASSIDGAILFKSSGGTGVITLQAPTTGPATYTLKLPTSAPALSQCLQNDGTTIGQLTFASCSGAAGANVTLSNLTGPTAINISLLPGVTNTIDAGSAALGFRSVYGATSVLTPLLDSFTAATALNVGTSNANAINLNQNTLVASGKTLTVGVPPAAVTGSQVVISPATNGTIGLVVEGLSGQTVNLLQFRDFSGSVLGGFRGGGGIYAAATAPFTNVTNSFGAGISTNAAAAFRAVSGQSVDTLQLQDFTGVTNSSFNSSGQLVVGRIGAAGLQGVVNFADGTTANSPQLQAAPSQTASPVFQLPAAATGTYAVCTTAAVCLGYANVALSNLTGPTAINTDLTFASGAGRSLTVTTPSTAATAGNNLTVQAATGNTTGSGGILALNGGTGGTTGAGGALTITGGNGGGGTTAGGNITLSGGAQSGVSTPGSVIVKPQAGNDSATAFQVQNAAGTSLFNVDSTSGNTLTSGQISSNSGFQVGNAAGLVTSCSGVQTLQNISVTGGITTSGVCGNTATTLQNVYDFSSVGASGYSTPTLVRQATASSTSQSNISTTISTSNGDLLVATIGPYTGASQNVSSVTDTAGNTWTKAAVGLVSNSFSRTEMWYSAGALPVTSVTINFSAAISATVNISEYSGVAGAAALDGATGQGNVGTTAGTTPVISTANSHDLIIAADSYGSVATTTAPGGAWTSLTDVDSSAPKHLRSAYQAVISSGSYSAAWTLSSATSNGSVIAAFQAASSGNNIAQILTSNAKDFVITAADTVTDSSVLINLQCTTCSANGGRFAVQNGGTDVLTVSPNNGGIIIGKVTSNIATTISGTFIAKPTASNDSATAFQIQNAAGTTLLVTDTINSRITIGSSIADTTQILLQLDSFSTFADTAACSTTTNQGALYYNTNSNSIRSCVNSAWSDVVTTSGLGIMLFGVLPDSGANPGDLPGLTTASVTGPCKVSASTSVTTSVTVAACTAYSGGRKIVYPGANVTLTTGVANGYIHLCFDTTGSLIQSGGATALAGLPTFSITAPLLCLADISISATANIPAAIYDARTFTTSEKEFVTTSATAPALGTIVVPNGAHVNQPALTVGLASRGVVVAASGTPSTTAPSAIIAISGPGWVKATAGSSGAIVQTGATTAGFAVTGAASATAYGNLGFSRSTFPAAACAAGVAASPVNCDRSLYTLINIK